MKAYKKQEVLQFEIIAKDMVVSLTDATGVATSIPEAEFSDRYEYVFKGGVTGECRLKRVIDDVEFLTDNKFVDVSKSEVMLIGKAGEALITYGPGAYSAMPMAFFKENYELTHSDEDIVLAFREIDVGMANNVHLSHANVVMVSKDHYAALCDLAYGLPKQLS